MEKIGLILLSFAIIPKVNAQALKLAGIEYFNYSQSAVKDEPVENQVSFQEFAAYANIPTKLKNGKTTMINGFRYAWVRPTVYDDLSLSENTQNFHSISLTLGFVHKFNNNWRGTLILNPTLASDFESSLSGEDFIMQGNFTLNKRLNEKLLIGGGIAYNTNLGIPLPIPIFQLFYKTGRHQINLILPAIAEYNYSVTSNEKFKVGFRTGINGAYFNYTADDHDEGNGEIDKINYSRLNAGPVISYRLGDYFQLEAFGGISAMRKYRFEDVNEKEIKFDTEPSGFFNIGIGLVIPESK